MIDTDAIRVDRELWAAPDGIGGMLSGDGSQSRPYRVPGGSLDALLPVLGTSCRIRMLTGEFNVRHFSPPQKTVLLHGAGVSATKINLPPNCTDGPFYPHIRMITDGGRYFTNFACTDMTIDGNWDAQPVHPNLKIQALSIEACVAHLRNVEVVNCGANGTLSGDAGLEAMPISVQTFANGDRQHYFPSMAFLWGAEPTTRLEVIDCRVRLSHFVKGGTETGIFIRTNSPANRQPAGTRTTEAALVRGCSVISPGGICYGGADLDMVTYEDNTGEGMCAFNADSLTANRTTIQNNRFFNCATGINVSPEHGGSGIRIDGNIVQLGGKFWNSVLRRFEPQWGIQLQRATGTGSRNVILVPDVLGLTPLSGIEGDNRVIVMGATDSGALAEAQARLAEATHQVGVLTAKNSDLQTKLSDELLASYEATARIVRLDKAVAGVREAVREV